VQVTDGAQPSASVQFTHHVSTVDQAVWTIDQQVAPPTITFGAGVELAQVFKTQMAGDVIAMGMPVSCDANAGVHLEIRGVTAGQPNATVLATGDIAPSLVGTFAPFIPYHRQLHLSAPLAMTRLTELAAVLSSSGTCHVTVAQPDAPGFTNSNPFGDAFTGSTGSWTALSIGDPSRPDVPFFSFTSDGGILDFASSGRSEGTATILTTGINAGLVLLAGGYTETTQLYNPTGATINGVLPGRLAAGASMNLLRAHHTATLLPDGSVLVVGGRDNNTGLASAELYDPATGTWSSAGQMSTARQSHTATLLTGNRVLIAGGQTDWNQPLFSSTEIFEYNPGTHTGQFVPGPSMTVGRAEHKAVPLTDGRVLFTGGWGSENATAELFTDSGGNGSFAATGAMQIGRADHTATLLNDDRVLIAGGWQLSVNAAALTGEVFDPTTNTFASVGANAARRNHLAVKLDDGRVVLAGGDDGAGTQLFTVDVFDPIPGTFSNAHELVVARGGVTGTHLAASNKILVVGGWSPSGAAWQSAEVLDPANLFAALAPQRRFGFTLNALAGVGRIWPGPACIATLIDEKAPARRLGLAAAAAVQRSAWIVFPTTAVGGDQPPPEH
jgi:galactose oxidase-like protein